VKEPAHRGWSELTSVQSGGYRSTSAAAGSSSIGRGQHGSKLSEFVVAKKQDRASPHLFRASLYGGGVKAVNDFLEAKDLSVYLRLVLSNTLIPSYTISGSGDRSTESLPLNLTKIELQSNPGTPPP
jgi:type VI protein secretion system component Hcp